MEKSVLITGASSGIGRATSLYLAAKGLKVYAGVRNVKDGENLLKLGSGNLAPVIIDVTDIQSINNTFNKIYAENDGNLFALVNNAGISLNCPLELASVDMIKKVVDVNLTGLLNVTKIFIPLLRQSQGKIVNVSSGHGLLALPDKSIYAATKFAVQAVTDSLRIELFPFNIKVASIIVGKVNTSALDKILKERENIIAHSATEIVTLYSDLFDYFDENVKDLPGIEADKVAETIEHALACNNPRPYYLIGPGTAKMKKLAALPLKLRDFLITKAIYK